MKFFRAGGSGGGSSTVLPSLTVDTNTLFVDSVNDRVGIGTATPAYKLDILASFSNTPTVFAVERVWFQSIGTMTVADRVHGITIAANDHANVVNKTITGAANNGSGLIRITSAAHGFVDGDRVGVYGVVGTTEANGAWVVTGATANTFDLTGSTFTNAYVSGGTATNRPMMYGIQSALNLKASRGGLTGTAQYGDDAAAFVGYNSSAGAFKATDMFYGGHNPVFGAGQPEWTTIFNSDANTQIFMQVGGRITSYAINFAPAVFETGAYAVNLGSNKLDIRSAAAGIQIVVGDATANAADKVGRIGGAHFTNIEEPVAMIMSSSTTGGSAVNIGGGSGVFNAATQVVLYTAANTTTITGTPRLTIGSTGVFTIWDGGNFVLGSTTGTQWGTAATQKQSFWGATPIVRPTGWAAATGTATRTTFATTTVTLPQLAEHVKALIDDLIAEGLIGA